MQADVTYEGHTGVEYARTPARIYIRTGFPSLPPPVIVRSKQTDAITIGQPQFLWDEQQRAGRFSHRSTHNIIRLVFVLVV